MPVVSVIIPIYNVEDYLERCLNSLVNQTIQDIEVILVNDGSTDKSGEICKIFERNDKRIKLINKKNGGVSTARNSGIEIASGRYISFIDPDDWVEINLLEVLMKNIIGNNSDMVVCGYRLVHDNGKIIRRKMAEGLIEINKIGINRYLQDDFLQFKHSFCVWNKLYKRDLIIKHTLRFDPESIYGEDLLFNLLYLSHSKIISTTSMELINYYQRTGSLSHSPENILHNTTQLVSKYETYTKKNHVVNLSLIVFCSEFSTALGHLRNSKDKDYVESCLISINKNKLFKNYCKKVLIDKECSDFLISQGNNFKGRLSFKLIILLLMLGRSSFVIKRLIKVAQ